MEFTIRNAREEDWPGISRISEIAFGRSTEGTLVRELARDGDLILSLVAENDDGIIGHIAYSSVTIDGQDAAAALGPMSVLPQYQHHGIGGRLVNEGLAHLKHGERSLVFVLGHTYFYPKFGFDAALANKFSAEWSGPAFMALRLFEGGPETGRVEYARAFQVF